MSHLLPLCDKIRMFLLCVYILPYLDFQKWLGSALFICFRPPSPLSRLYYKYYSDNDEFGNICSCGEKEKQFYFRNYDRRSEQVTKTVLPLFQISVTELAAFLGGASPIWTVYRTCDSKIQQMANSLRQRLDIPDAWTCWEAPLKMGVEFALWQDGIVCFKKR